MSETNANPFSNLINPVTLKLRSGSSIDIPRCRYLFRKWEGEPIEDTYGGKALIEFDKKAIFAELAILGTLQRAGWDGVWVDTNCARVCWSDIGVDFREQPDYGASHSSLIRIVLNGADNLLVVKTFAARIALRPPKLPDLGTSFAIESLHTPMLHLSPPSPPWRSRRILKYEGE